MLLEGTMLLEGVVYVDNRLSLSPSYQVVRGNLTSVELCVS
jgi:hypothetical protein